MNLLNNFHFQSLGIGASGATLAGVIPSPSHDLIQLGILFFTAIIQIIHLKQKNKSDK
jgi:hypothetical protein